MSALHESTELVQTLVTSLVDLGIEEERFFEQLGVSKSEINENFFEQWVDAPLSAKLPFMLTVVDISEDPDIGLHIGERSTFGNVIEYLLLSSDSLEEALTLFSNHGHVMADSLNFELETSNESCCVYFHSQYDRHINEALMVHLFRLLQLATRKKFRADKICFTHEEPENIYEHKRVFGCPVEFGGNTNRIYFSNELLRIKPFMANAALKKSLISVIDKKLVEIDEKSNLLKSKIAITELLGTEDVTLEAVAEKLSMPPKKLKHQLINQGTSFTSIVSNRRSELAIQLLTKTDKSIDTIVEMLGFAEVSSFYRAFKRWHGMTPIQYREAYFNELH